MFDHMPATDESSPSFVVKSNDGWLLDDIDGDTDAPLPVVCDVSTDSMFVVALPCKSPHSNFFKSFASTVLLFTMGLNSEFNDVSFVSSFND